MIKRVTLLMLLPLALLLLSSPARLAAQSHIDSLISTWNQQPAAHPTELIYLQTSKDCYETGEDLWFKAYQLDALSFGLSAKSQTLYLQLVNEMDSAVWQEKYPIDGGLANGHLYIDEKLPDGDYHLEGFTRHSFHRHDTAAILPARKIRIVKNIARATMADKPKESSLRFELFPEGGHLVAGLSTQLAFKATDGKGNPLPVEGTLYQNEQPIGQLQSRHDGMGAIPFTPIAGSSYRVMVGGNSYPLPNIQPEGMALRLTEQSEKQIKFTVLQSPNLPPQPIYLVGQMRGAVCCLAKGVLNDSLTIAIPTENFLYQGIAEFTLLNGQMQPVAERLAYLHPERRLHISLETDQKSYTLRQKGSLKVKVTDQDGQPVQANLALSLYDQAYYNPANPVRMDSYCYLTSQIRGSIFNPAYYFDDKNRDRGECLDLLLLTQGWRCYVWNRQTYTPSPALPFLMDEIAGLQTLPSKKRSAAGQGSEQLIQISGPEGKPQFIWADSLGHFTIPTEMMRELRGGYLYLKPMLSQEFKPTLHLADCFPEIDSARQGLRHYDPIIDLTQYTQLPALKLPVVSEDSTILLNEVTVTSKGRKPFRDKMMGRLDSLARMDLNTAWVCDCGSHTRNGYLNDYMGYSHHPAGCSACRSVRNRSIPIHGKDYELIKYEPKGADGTWIVTDIKIITYNGPEFTEEELLRMNNLWRTKGYYATREFYQPDEVDILLSTPDARNTLLWQPSLITDQKGEATVPFYCSDINTVFVGIAEGVDGSGLLGTGKCEFRVVRDVNIYTPLPTISCH